MTELRALAKVGDIIECDVRHPYPRVLREKLLTQPAVTFANTLLADKNSGWRLSDRASLDGEAK